MAERYTSQNPELTGLIGELEYAISLTQNSYSDFSDEAQANQLMGDAAQNLYEELKQTELSESDEKYPDQSLPRWSLSRIRSTAPAITTRRGS
mgnify:CR=1 FL=1